MEESTWKLSSPSPVLYSTPVLYCTALYCTCTPTPASRCTMDRWGRHTRPAVARSHLHTITPCISLSPWSSGWWRRGRRRRGWGCRPPPRGRRRTRCWCGGGASGTCLHRALSTSQERGHHITCLSPGSRSRAAGLHKKIPPVQTWSQYTHITLANFNTVAWQALSPLSESTSFCSQYISYISASPWQLSWGWFQCKAVLFWFIFYTSNLVAFGTAYLTFVFHYSYSKKVILQ